MIADNRALAACRNDSVGILDKLAGIAAADLCDNADMGGKR